MELPKCEQCHKDIDLKKPFKVLTEVSNEVEKKFFCSDFCFLMCYQIEGEITK